jgi:hypothetical protein
MRTAERKSSKRLPPTEIGASVGLGGIGLGRLGCRRKVQDFYVKGKIVIAVILKNWPLSNLVEHENCPKFEVTLISSVFKSYVRVSAGGRKSTSPTTPFTCASFFPPISNGFFLAKIQPTTTS